MSSRQTALTDPLTQLPNRRAFFRDAEPVAHPRNEVPVSCLLFDLDHFKEVNDVFGHQAGDRILTHFAGLLKEHVSGPHGRIGGEEFAAIVEGDEATACRIGNAIRISLAEKSIDVGDQRIRVTVSVGSATAIGLTSDELLEQADSALYAAKAQGRNMLVSARLTPSHSRHFLPSRSS